MENLDKQILSEFTLAGWHCQASNIFQVVIVRPQLGHYKHYYLMKVEGDWLLSSSIQPRDPEHDEALEILERAKSKMASDR